MKKKKNKTRSKRKRKIKDVAGDIKRKGTCWLDYEWERRFWETREVEICDVLIGEATKESWHLWGID